jgi:HK97 family phage major capsid protein
MKKLREELHEMVMTARNMHAEIEKEGRAFKPEENIKWEEINKRIDDLKARLKTSERALDLGQMIDASAGVRTLAANGGVVTNPEQDLNRRAFNAYLQRGMSEMPDELRDVAKRSFIAGTNNVGGYTVPQAFYDQLEVALKAWGGLMAAGEIIRTDKGNALPMPTFNYTAVAATIIGEGSASTNDSSTPFGQVVMNAYTYRSPLLPVSVEFLQDSAFGESYITDALGQSIARGYNAHATTGTGTGQPKGIVTASVSGKVGTTGQTTSVIFDDLIDLVHSIDPAYRPTSSFMLHDTSLAKVRKIKDTSGRPIFIPGFDGLGKPMPDTILGYPVTINQDMAQMAANTKSILFGAMKKYKIRIAKDVQVLRLAERYADQLQVAFLLFARMDGNLLDAGTNPVKYYQNSAS